MLAIRLLVLALFMTHSVAAAMPTSQRAELAIANIEPALKKQLVAKQLKYGSEIFIRIFKEPGVLELWVKGESEKIALFKRYPICAFSGQLGPKLKEGDKQSPEGFYYVGPRQLNPRSRFHLSFNLGFPNRYDQHHGRTGSALMVHGNCVSIGCYAMTDAYVEEIYALAVAALKGGQPFFRVHIFPFALEDEALKPYIGNPNFRFWQNLKQGYDYFEAEGQPPNVNVKNGQYVFGPNI